MSGDAANTANSMPKRRLMRTIVGLNDAGKRSMVPVCCLVCHGLHLPVMTGSQGLFRGSCRSANKRKTVKFGDGPAHVAI